MRKLKLQVQITVDGFIAGQNGETNWMTLNWSEDIKNYVDKITLPVDTILLGRNLAEGFIPHWAKVAMEDNNPEKKAGIKFTETPKIVFSKTLKKSKWENTAIENGDFVKKVKSLKKENGGDIIVYGGSTFVSSLIKKALIDELHLFVNPAILGNGLPVFKEVTTTQKLELVKSKQFNCGIILLVYKSL